MSRYRKIVWNEGMLLTPHHFQQFDNYYEHLIAGRLATLFPYDWGVLELKVDREAIANGSFRLTTCRAVMPDGLMVNIPDSDPTPVSRSLEGHLRQVDERLDIYLGIPAKRDGAANLQSNGSSHNSLMRFQQEMDEVFDETTGRNKQQLAFAHGNFQILFADEVERGGYEVLKIAELRRTANGLRVTERYVPPVLDIAVSVWLKATLNELIETLIAKSSELKEQLRRTASGVYDLNNSKVGYLCLLQTVNAAVPVLAHMKNMRMVHPERLYLELVRLLGMLMIVSPNHHPKDILPYDHRNLFPIFSKLLNEIVQLLKLAIPDKCVSIPLEHVRSAIHVGQISDAGLLEEAVFYLGVQAEMPINELITKVPTVIIVAADGDMDAFVNAAMLGIPLRHNASPPAAIPVENDKLEQCFQIERHSDFWNEIKKTKRLAIYLPGEIKAGKLKLYAVKP